MISRHLRRIAADSNVLLSAIVGGAALKILTHPEIEVITTRFNLDEVEEYVPRMAARYRLEEHSLLLQLAMLPVTIFTQTHYQSHMPQAQKYLKNRDLDDIHLAALALKERVPIWSNDKDLASMPLPAYPTAQFLQLLKSDS